MQGDEVGCKQRCSLQQGLRHPDGEGRASADARTEFADSMVDSCVWLGSERFEGPVEAGGRVGLRMTRRDEDQYSGAGRSTRPLAM